MTRIEKIEREVEALTQEELAKFRAWFLAFDADLWDERFAADVAAGKLDQLAEDALAEHRQGKSTKL